MSPWKDLALTGATLADRASDDPLLTKEMLAIMGARYLTGRDARDPLVSPLYGNLAGLPPIQLHVGTSEILFDDARRYADRASAAGVDATIHVWEGMTHVFPASLGVLGAADEAIGLLATFLDDHWTSNLKVPPDDPSRYLSVIDPDDPALRHVSMVRKWRPSSRRRARSHHGTARSCSSREDHAPHFVLGRPTPNTPPAAARLT